ncbi:MAG: hypothetical protein A2Z72_03055 [Omnitrophica bacterium RBG_13_46_9]|nr:MAG: hypothetical protein A2Z72_03055 [Omnitrophica bacterium RBG_13_46_9]
MEAPFELCMKKILFIFIALWFLANTAYPYEYRDQKRDNIVKALQEKPDLAGEDKRSIELRFGPPIFRKTLTEQEGIKERWVYRPFKRGLEHIEIIFLNGQVVETNYKRK